MAPEVLKGNTYDAKADIWSLGITSIEMALGRVPHCEKAPLQALFVIPKSPPPTLPPEDDWSTEFREFIALCCTMEPENRPTAAQLLKNKWIIGAKGLKVTQALVEKSLPIMEELRKQKVLAQIRTENENENGDENQHTTHENEEEENQYGTFISPQNAKVKNNNHNGDEDNDNNDDEFKGGTMLVSANSLVKNDKNENENEENEENEEQFDGGTMVTPAVVSKPKSQQQQQQQPQPQPQPQPQQPNKRAKTFKSVFEGNVDISKKDPMIIPDDVTKEELVQIWHKIRNTANEDKKKFEEWYKKQFDLLDKWIQQLDNKQK